MPVSDSTLVEKLIMNNFLEINFFKGYDYCAILTTRSGHHQRQALSPKKAIQKSCQTHNI
jgi:cell division protein FtsL